MILTYLLDSRGALVCVNKIWTDESFQQMHELLFDKRERANDEREWQESDCDSAAPLHKRTESELPSDCLGLIQTAFASGATGHFFRFFIDNPFQA